MATTDAFTDTKNRFMGTQATIDEYNKLLGCLRNIAMRLKSADSFKQFIANHLGRITDGNRHNPHTAPRSINQEKLAELRQLMATLCAAGISPHIQPAR